MSVRTYVTIIYCVIDAPCFILFRFKDNIPNTMYNNILHACRTDTTDL